MKQVKPIVNYSWLAADPVVGGRALLRPVNHPSPHITNGERVLTSTIVSVMDDGEGFETLNTVYVPLET
jgi:hypothetical protein